MTYAQLSAVRMQYVEHGHDPEVVVLVHGFQASARIWQLVQAELPEDRYRTIALNNRGAGETDAPAQESDFSVECFASDLYELVSQLGLRDFTLVGHSLGGATATRFALDHGELLKALVVLDPVDPDRAPMAAADVEAAVDATIHAMTRGRSAAAAQPANANTPAAAAPNTRAAFALALAADMAAAPERRLRGSMRSMLTLAMGKAIRQLAMPVLFACGDADELFPIDLLLATRAKYPESTALHVWHGVGHSPNVEIPERVAALLRRFIERTLPGKQRAPGA